MLVAITLIAGCGRCGPAPLRNRVDVNVQLHPHTYDRMLRLMDEAGISTVVNLSGGPPGEVLATMVELTDLTKHRILATSNIDWRDVNAADFGARAARNLQRAVDLGARGLVVTRALGMGIETEDGQLLRVDDPRLDPVWARAGELDLPVWLDTAGTEQEFTEAPVEVPSQDAAPAYVTGQDRLGNASRRELLMQRIMVITRHPATHFICPSLASEPEDPGGIDALLDIYSNLHVDTAGVLQELAMHSPDLVRAFFLKHSSRILFGSGLQLNRTTAASPDSQSDDERRAFYQEYWRYLESTEERDRDGSAATTWGLGLPRRVLEQIYSGNAQRLLKNAPR